MKPRVLVLGGDGFIGRRVAQAVIDSQQLTAVVASRRGVTSCKDAKALRLDVGNTEALARTLDGCAAVVDCTAGSPEQIRSHARSLTQALTSRSHGPLLVHLSSMAVYGAARGRVVENSECLPTTAYGCAKLDGEHMLSLYPQRVVLRPGCVYGVGGKQWSLDIARLLMQRRVGYLGAAGSGHANLVHVDDVADSVVRLLTGPRRTGECFNLAMPEAPTWNEYFALFAMMLGTVPLRNIGDRRLRLETRLLAPALVMLERCARSLGRGLRWPAITPSASNLWSQRIFVDSSKAHAQLLPQWRPLSPALAEVARWALGVDRTREAGAPPMSPSRSP